MTTSFRRPLTIRRAAPGTYVAGVWQPGAETEMTIEATVQPATAGDYDRMTAEHGGERLTRMIRVYTDTELLIADPAATQAATAQGAATLQTGDVVIYSPPLARAPGRYRVVGQSIWAGGMTLDHFRYLAAMEPAA